jgi:hypothetical protein
LEIESFDRFFAVFPPRCASFRPHVRRSLMEGVVPVPQPISFDDAVVSTYRANRTVDKRFPVVTSVSAQEAV